jgi:hypothetical protein
MTVIALIRIPIQEDANPIMIFERKVRSRALV